MNRREPQPAGRDAVQVVRGRGDAAAGAAEGERRADDDRIADRGREIHRVVDGFDDLGRNRRFADLAHRVLKGLTVFGLVDGFHVRAEELDAVCFEEAAARQGHRQVEACLAAEGRQHSVGLFLQDDPLDDVLGQRFDVDFVGHRLVGHDRRRIGVDEHDLQPRLAQRFAGLGAGVVKFRRLSDNDRAGTDDQYFLQFFL